MNRPNVESSESRPARRVLLVEDNVASGAGLARLLQAHGFDVTTVPDGASALEVLDRAPPDFLLTDLRLPDLDGRELARRATHLTPRPVIGLVTGWDLEPNEDLSGWGIDWVVPKPVRIDQLLQHMSPSE